MKVWYLPTILELPREVDVLDIDNDWVWIIDLGGNTIKRDRGYKSMVHYHLSAKEALDELIKHQEAALAEYQVLVQRLGEARRLRGKL